MHRSWKPAPQYNATILRTTRSHSCWRHLVAKDTTIPPTGYHDDQEASLLQHRIPVHVPLFMPRHSMPGSSCRLARQRGASSPAYASFVKQFNLYNTPLAILQTVAARVAQAAHCTSCTNRWVPAHVRSESGFPA